MPVLRTKEPSTKVPKKKNNSSMELLEKYIVKRNGDYKDGLAFQKRARS